MVLLALLWASGWFTGVDKFRDVENPLAVMGIVAAVLAAWNLLSAVIAAGFFHAASVYPSKTFKAYKAASFRLVLCGLIMLFPVPVMAQVLGNSAGGRALALIITSISIAGVIFSRARLRLIENRLTSLWGLTRTESTTVEEIDQFGETAVL
jgi:hypothetical protein